MAGGISNCADWQSEMASKLENVNLTIINPRRDYFDLSDENASPVQNSVKVIGVCLWSTCENNRTSSPTEKYLGTCWTIVCLYLLCSDFEGPVQF